MTATINDYSPRIGRKAGLPVWSADGGVYGRDAEWRAVGELLRRARRGAGGVVLVEGEQGIGKSRLLGESVSEAAGQGFSLAAGAADRLGWTIPFFASRAALRADLEKRAAVAPVLVSLDDLQWASPAMLAALRACTSRPLGDDELAAAMAWNIVVPPAIRGALLSRELDGSDVLARTSVPVLVSHGRQPVRSGPL